MNSCQRFEQEALLRLEQGLPLDDHFRTCADCRNARIFYEQLQGDIASVEDIRSPSDWQSGVWNRIATTKRKSHLSPWLYIATPALAATILAFIVVPRLVREPTLPTIHADIAEGSGQTQRGDVTVGTTIVLGSRLELTAATGGGPYAELRVYRNDDQLVLQIFRTSGAASVNDVIHATLLLDAVGRYQPVLFVSSQSIPPPSGTRDDDYAMARKAGAQTIPASEISVR